MIVMGFEWMPEGMKAEFSIPSPLPRREIAASNATPIRKNTLPGGPFVRSQD